MHKLSSLHERKAKPSSSSSFSGFSPLMLVPPCQLLSPAGVVVVTTTTLSTVFAVAFLASAPIVSATPFVLPMDVTPVESGC